MAGFRAALLQGPWLAGLLSLFLLAGLRAVSNSVGGWRQ
jgi:hypothetical protein